MLSEEEQEQRDMLLGVTDILMPEELDLTSQEEEQLVCILNTKPNITYYMIICNSNKCKEMNVL